MLEPSQNGGDEERERRKKGIELTTVTSEDSLLSKRMVGKRGITTKEGYLVHLQVCCPPKQIWSIS
jgi:hypothetical protein